MAEPPPEVFTQPVIICPGCGHGIDPHGLDPGGRCGVGIALDEGVRGIRTCDCLWSPNDIAATLIAANRPAVVYLVCVSYEGAVSAVFTTKEAAIAWAHEYYGDWVEEVPVDDSDWNIRKHVWNRSET